MEATFAELLSHAPVFLRRPDGGILFWATGCEELYGYTAAEAAGRISHELLKTQFPRPLPEIDKALRREGEWRGRLRHVSKDGRPIWTETLWRLRHPNSAEAALVVEQNTDVSERVEVEAQRELLAQELDHRVKNTLAVVQALARFSFAGEDRGAVGRFEQRLGVLSQAHSILRREHWRSASLQEVLQTAIEPLGMRDRVSIAGPPVRLTPNSAVAYALAFHELATNAATHGALGGVSGRVDVSWSLQGSELDEIDLTWRETGGPPVTQPAHEGFGATLIRRALAAELNAPVQLPYDAAGLVCRLAGRILKDPVGIA